MKATAMSDRDHKLEMYGAVLGNLSLFVPA